MLGKTTITRFAPSPTGHLHLGHVTSALYVWGIAAAISKSSESKIWLRIEDHDRSRCRPEYEASICRDLDWLGFVATNNPLTAEFRQSTSNHHYQQALERLIATGRVYACDCSRKRIAETMVVSADVPEPAGELKYDGRCRHRGLALDTPDTGLRLVLDDHLEEFDDLLLGPQKQQPSQQGGDLLLRDRHGQWTYHFAVVVDDMRHGVNLIVRGQDLTASTGRQLQLARLLGQTHAPRYFHHRLLTDGAGKKLSKRFFSEAIGARRHAGESAAAILGDAVWRDGLVPHLPDAQTFTFKMAVDLIAHAHRGLLTL